MKRLKRTEIEEIINSLNPKKSPRYDLITGKILKNCPIFEYSILHSCSM
jgi:hypothetical protein